MKTRLIALCAMLALALGVSLGATPASAESEFKIGIVASLSGPFASAGKDTMDGLDAWVKAHGLPGKKIVFETLDDETNPVHASNAFRRLANDPKVQLIYLFIPSSSALAVKSLASEFKVPIVSGGAADELGVPADPYLFKVAPAVHDFMIVLCEYAKKHNLKKIAMMNATDAYGQSQAANIKQLAPKYGMTVVADETFSVDDTSFNAQMTRIRASNADVIFNGASGRAAILSYKQMKQMGFKQPVIVSQAFIGKAFYEAIGGTKEADGLLLPIQLGSFGPAVGGDTARLYAEMQKALGRPPVYFNTFGYDVGIITAAAVEHSDGTRKGLRDALDKIKDLPGVNGPITYTPKDHTGQNFRSITMGKLLDGKAVLAN
ncbi:MAG TPA: ABC transporter substrate-binding protein [Alphaproteobacteria bacterium]|nr:ABC transporter substrate-binding protein [Alphaproteobacteria bacterium]